MGFSREKPSKHLTVFSPETVNIKKLANLTANTKNYRQITLNTRPHSDPLRCESTTLVLLVKRKIEANPNTILPSLRRYTACHQIPARQTLTFALTSGLSLV